ncbi:MAG: thermonuclease family protein [Planctomycetota bacterium]
MSRAAARFRRRRWPWLVAAGLLATVVIADRCGWLLVGRGDDMSAYHGTAARVARAIDGDTLEIEIPDHLHRRPITQVRLWGVDSPEMAGRGHPAEPFADEARALTHKLAAGGPVTLTLEPHRTRGSFGRLLAHVELPDGSSLNEALLAAGLARADDRWPHALLGRYAQLERAARREGVGIWSQPEPTDP